MIIKEYFNNHSFSYDTETKLLEIDDFSEHSFSVDINGIKTLMNMFKFLDDNKLL